MIKIAALRRGAEVAKSKEVEILQSYAPWYQDFPFIHQINFTKKGKSIIKQT